MEPRLADDSDKIPIPALRILHESKPVRARADVPSRSSEFSAMQRVAKWDKFLWSIAHVVRYVE